MFKALLINNTPDYSAQLQTLQQSDLPDNEVIVQVDYSSLNYKDALAITGRSPIVKAFPMIPGIDLAGTVVSSRSSRYQPNDRVMLNGWGVGEKYWGGLARYASVAAEWLLPIPRALNAKQVMSIGTAGYTAMLAIMAIEQHGITPNQGKVLVTGASGGVGSFAVAWLAKLGYHVIAATGRSDQSDYLLHHLGAKEIIPRAELASVSKPLLKERWIAAIDTLGSATLANVCASTAYQGIVAACGLAQGLDFPSTVAPFILRGITLTGIDSVMCPYSQRAAAWQRIAYLTPPALLPDIAKEITLEQVITSASQLLAGAIRGRVVVRLTDD